MSAIFSLDITEDLITWVLLDTSAKPAVVKGHGILCADNRPLEETLPEIVSEAGFTGGECRVSFGPEDCFFRNLTVPFPDRKKIARILPFELEETSPHNMARLHLDFLSTPNDSGETEVFAAMVDRELFAERLAVLQGSAMDPTIISLGGVQTAAALAGKSEVPDDFLFFDIGPRRATIIVIHNRRIVFIRSLAFDPENLVGYHQDALSMHVVAEHPEHVAELLEQFCHTVKQTLFAVPIGVVPKNELPIYLDGPLASDPEVTAGIHTGLPGEIHHFDLRKQTLLTKEAQEADNWNPCFMNRVLALAEYQGKTGEILNFRVGDFSRKRSFSEYRRFLPIIAVSLTCVLLVTMGLAWYEFHTMQQKNESLQGQIEKIFMATLPEVTRIVNPLQQLKIELLETKKTVSAGAQSHTGLGMLSILADISAHIPDTLQIRITRMVSDLNTVRLKGVTADFNTVDRMQKELQKSPLYNSVTISSANLAPKGEEVRFELKLEFRED